MKGLSIHITDQCNQSCKFCVVGSYKEKRDTVNLKIIDSFLSLNAGKGYEVVNIHGGEPTILEELEEILKKIKFYGYPIVTIQTNGRTLSDREYARKLYYDYNVKRFVISFHTNDLQTFTELTGEDINTYKNIIAGIKNCLEFGAYVRTNTVIYNGNFKCINDVIEYLTGELGVKFINISALHPVGRAYVNFKTVCPTYQESMFYLDKVLERHEKSPTYSLTLEGFPYCVLGKYTKYLIDWDENKFKLLYHNTLLEEYDKFMKNDMKAKLECCVNCKMLELCGGPYKEYYEFYGKKEFSSDTLQGIIPF